ncbi:MAG TPA: 50S ribosomal protein L11 methyltransferase [Firmicutes bacterium]|jgi:ribosomal protein L11 methyltransferase|nr:50S ribosomal protein L11 methyltransferase [Bacillota bacterium]
MLEKSKGLWVEICVTTTPEAGEMVGELLLETGCQGVVYHDPRLYETLQAEPAELRPTRGTESGPYRVAGYLAFTADWEEKLRSLESRIEELRAFLPIGSGQITLRRIKEEDWATAWKEYYQPERVGRFLITPSWLSPTPALDEITIRLDPGMAFGTGTHPTTQLCLELLPRAAQPGALVYDIGTGSGILAIAAAKLGAKVIAVDRDPVAAAVAAENCALNQVMVSVRTGDLLNDLEEPADLVIANILAEVVIELIPQAIPRLTSGGALLASGIIASKAGQVQAALTAARFKIIHSLQKEDWLAYLAVRDGD